MPVEEGAPMGPEGAPMGGEGAPQGGQDPIMMIAQMFAQGLQSQDCNMLAQGAQAFLELISQASAPEAQGQPTFKKGGRIVRKAPQLTLVRK